MSNVHVSCKVCDTNSADFLFEKNGWDIVRCCNCGFVYTNPIPTREDVERYYSSGAKMRWGKAAFSVEKVSKDSHQLKTIKSPLGRIWVRQLRLIRWNKHLPQQGRFLDVGCAQGHLVLAAKRMAKWDCVGVDIQMHKLRHAHLVDPYANIILGAVDKLGFKAETFDIVTMTHVLEHTFDPVKTLLELYAVLRNNGVGVITVPNITHPYARLMGKRWPSIRPPGHLWFFSPETLERLVKKVGMEVIHKEVLVFRPNFTIIASKGEKRKRVYGALQDQRH
ncbi:MAG: class I SAM-dependent methyltransferase [Planctomycetota bacterium]|jgi:2-polyprenyl-3-methyl-5-hydroxy-6-metoxy-1,4-benzoquinol methylase